MQEEDDDQAGATVVVDPGALGTATAGVPPAEDPVAGFDAHKARTKEDHDVAEELAQREAELVNNEPVIPREPVEEDHGFDENNPTRRVTGDRGPKPEE